MRLPGGTQGRGTPRHAGRGLAPWPIERIDDQAGAQAARWVSFLLSPLLSFSPLMRSNRFYGMFGTGYQSPSSPAETSNRSPEPISWMQIFPEAFRPAKRELNPWETPYP